MHLLRFPRPLLLGLSIVLFVSVSCKQSGKPGSKKDKYDGPEQAAAFEVERTMDPATGKVPWDQLLQAKLQTDAARDVARLNRTAALSWIERGSDTDVVGPSNGNSRANNGVTSGRIRAMMVDSLDPTRRTVFVGGVAGGLWKTTDITATPANWTLVDDFLPNLAVAAICQDPRPGFQQIMYMCTGESFFNFDAVQGVGVFKSVDAGNTWTFLPSTSNYTFGTRILCDFQGNVYLGTRGFGLLRSSDGGNSWTDITPTGIGNRVCDLEISSTGGPARLHVATGISSTSGYRFTDNPATVTAGTWTAPTTPYTTFSRRSDFAVNGSTLYSIVCNASNQVSEVWKSTDGGDNWATTAGTPPNTVSGSPFANGQAWYDLSVRINPANPDECIIGAIDCARTLNGGNNWTRISAWVGTGGQYVHADQHDIQWWDGGNKLAFACDGGVHYSSDKGTTIRDRNVGLRLKQFYSVAIHPTSANYILAGAQDNGVHQLNGPGLTSSVEVTGGDGAYVAIDQDEPQFQFGSYVYNVYRRSTNGGATWSTPVNNQSTGRFINPWDYDNTNNIIYACNNAGTFLRWNNPQTGNTTSVITMSDFGTGNVSAVHVSPYTNHRVYFGMGSGTLFAVDNANTATPTATNITPAGATGYLNCVVTGSSDQVLMACYSSYNVTNVWISTNGGSTWTGIDGNLPNMPVRWGLFHPDTDTKAFIATETGVWETDLINGTSTVWSANPSFPNTRTDMIKYRASDRTIAAGTHGRGVWTAQVAAPSGFSFNNPAPASAACPAPTTMTVTLGTISNGGFSNSISLSATAGVPAGTFVSFGTNPVIPGNSSVITLNNTSNLAPGNYTITITGVASGAPTQTRDIVFAITAGAGPAISGQPAAQTLCAGENASFLVSASGATAYQWQISTNGGASWNNITGALASTYTISGVTAGLSGNLYRCVVSNTCGSTNSAAALLTVNTAPAITSQPQSATACTGNDQSFTVSATGSGLGYQWQISTNGGASFSNISGANGSSYTVTGVTLPMGGNQYRCEITGSCPPSVTSATAVLTVVSSLNITAQPADQTVCEGSPAIFSVTATGATSYQWQFSTDGGSTWTNITGANSVSYTIPLAAANQSGHRFRCQVSGPCGTTNSASALLTVNTLPFISTQPQDITLCAGSNHTFSVTASGTGIGYQWQQSLNGCSGPWSNISGATSASYTINGITAGQNNTGYRCVVTGTCTPAAVSACAVLNVVTSVTVATQPADQAVCAGSTANFSVAGTGSDIIYQWQISTDGGTSWNNISGANTATYSLTNAPVSANGNRYRCLLSNTTCTTPGVSTAALLTVNALPAVGTQPADATICTGSTHTFSVTASGTGISYQWQLSTDGGTAWNNISGANSTTYTTASATIGMNGNRYRCVVTGVCSPAATSSAALLTVIAPPVITAQPAAAEVCSQGNTSFSVTATSSQTIVYQWQVSTDGGTTWTNVSGANSSTLTLNSVAASLNNNRYRCQLSNATCTTPVNSAAALLTVRVTPTIGLTASPVTSLLPGRTTTLTASPSATTGGTLSSSWLYNNSPLTVTGNSYVVNVEQIGSYQARIQESWPGGLVCSSQSAVVTIDAPASSTLFIFPSPNDGRFTVSYYNSGNTTTRRTIMVYDSKGAQVYSAKFNINGPYTLLNVDLRPAQTGIYYVLVGDESGKRLAEGKVLVGK